MNEQLTKDFNASEFFVTDTGLNNDPPTMRDYLDVMANIKHIALRFLQPLRDHFGLPVTITSGYRSPEVNKAVGGSKTSQHTKGEAVDFVVKGKTNEEIIDAIHHLGLPYDQLIDEQLNSKWIHVSLKFVGNRKEHLTARKHPVTGKTVYARVG